MEVVQAPGGVRRTLREVCRRAGCSPSMIQYHFGGKVGLFRAAQEQCFDPLVKQVGKATEGVPSAVYVRLWELYGQVRRLARSYPDAFRVLRGPLLDEPERHPYVWECRKRMARMICELIAQGVAEGDLRPDLDRAAVTDWFLLFCIGSDEDPNTGFARESLARFDLFCRGIAHPRSPRCRPMPWKSRTRRLA